MTLRVHWYIIMQQQQTASRNKTCKLSISGNALVHHIALIALVSYQQTAGNITPGLCHVSLGTEKEGDLSSNCGTRNIGMA